jgi:thymidylate synthase
MRKVFFSTAPNQFGHSYADKIRGPQGRGDLSDVVELLAREPSSKRAAIALVGSGDGQVPCINAVHFLRREEGLFVSYFSRGQDVFRKFYADGVCLCEMGERVAGALGIPMVQVAGLISSAHIYLADLPEAQGMLAEMEGSKQQAANLREGRA